MGVFLQEQFKALDKSAKIAHILEYGIYLDVYRLCSGCTVFLYSLYGFYVEVWMREKDVVKTNSFESYKKLDLYISEIDISEALSLL